MPKSFQDSVESRIAGLRDSSPPQESRITPEMKAKISSEVDRMIAEDLAKGRTPTENARKVYFDNVSTYLIGDSPTPSEKFWLEEEGDKKTSTEQKIVAENLFNRQKSTTEYDPSTIQKKSFSDVVSPFYRGAFNEELDKARRYATELDAPTQGPVRGADFSKLKDPNRAQEKIPVYTAKNPDSSQPARANYNMRTDSIIMGEDFKYGTGKPVVIEMNGREVTLPASSSFLDVLNHEMGHSMYPAAKGLKKDVAGPAYYDIPAEMITELAYAQRQQYKDTGKRFTEESFIDFMNKAKKNEKDLDRFSPMTKDAFRNLLDGTDEEVETRVKQAAKVIPALVKQGTAGRTIS